jgi:murein DD-endopeptidase MepM/ murein hydrolase activator NlpD
MKLTYPVSPIHLNQAFGANPEYYSKFLDANGNPEKGHMGIDLMAAHGQPVYAAHDGFAYYVGPDSHGGDGVYLRFEDEDVPGTYWTVIYWHLCAKDDPQYAPLVDGNGGYVKTGDLLGYADNTGAPFESSGDHLHFGLAPCSSGGGFLEPSNGYGGCVDPQPYLDDLTGLIKSEVQVLNTQTDPIVRSSFLALIIQQLKVWISSFQSKS